MFRYTCIERGGEREKVRQRQRKREGDEDRDSMIAVWVY
jgi:hypothetical protein